MSLFINSILLKITFDENIFKKLESVYFEEKLRLYSRWSKPDPVSFFIYKQKFIKRVIGTLTREH